MLYFKKGLNSILGTIHSYPTMSEANKYAAGIWKQGTKPEKLLKYVEKGVHKGRIVTGKGESVDSIRNNLLNWINGNLEIKKIISFIGQAHQKCGGNGAFYCYLKKYQD